ncbi:hypothetical protein K503DRAFT_807157 [Rhizopogon vinicolor AM-OR11-026]|uniref:Uncharacterized protein n=1 Tax=Rhizopogon vinicolor AM-OR11-026 TaxID=1314800 RepID=A0A1B7MD34_9AGAM|nr:hypothetical protein K503DRAFT_807157 [Rhizopogon vinicolor AM-OR11-026]
MAASISKLPFLALESQDAPRDYSTTATPSYHYEDSRQHQPHQPAPESDPTANTSINASTLSHLSQTPTHSHAHAQSHPRTRAKHSGKNTLTNCPVLTVQTSFSTKPSLFISGSLAPA